MRSSQFWVDGIEAAGLPADDRGLLLADGVFETLWWDGVRLLYSEFHEARLIHGLTVLRFQEPEQQARDALTSLQTVLEGAAALVTGVVRLTLTRGSGPRGYRPPTTANARAIVAFYPAETSGFQPLRLGWSEIRWSYQPLFASAKLLARTEQVLAAAQALEQGVDDVLMMDTEAHVISSSCANVLARFGQQLLTPKLEGLGIAGTRLAVIRDYIAARHGLSVRDVSLSREDLLDADEVLLCNAVRGVQCAAQLESREWHDFALGLALHDDLVAGRIDA